MNKKVLAAKALGFSTSISNMPDAQRGRMPSKTFGEDYNNLLKYIVEELPEIEKYLPPKTVFSFDPDSGGYYCDETYDEIGTYCEQIYQMLNAVEG